VVVGLLVECCGSRNDESMDALVGFASSQQLRDVTYSETVCGHFSELILYAWGLGDTKYVESVRKIVRMFMGFPECTDQVSGLVFSYEVGVGALKRLEQNDALDDEEQGLLIEIGYRSYAHGGGKTRQRLRGVIGGMLERVLEKHERFHICKPVLTILGSIIRGFQSPLSRSNKEMGLNLLVPFHGTRGKATPSTSILGLFHKELVMCMTAIISKDFSLGDIVLVSILNLWPTKWEGNSPKEVLVLHECEALLELENIEIKEATAQQMVEKLSEAIASDNSMVCERALGYWENPKVINVLFAAGCRKSFISAVVVPLVQHAVTHWNKTVTIMAGHVLKLLMDQWPEELMDACCIVWEMPSERDRVKARVERMIESLARKDDTQMLAEAKAAMSSEGQVATVAPDKQLDISFMNMIVGNELGDGSFSKVYYALKAEPGKPKSLWREYALKRVNAASHRDLALREAAMMDRIVDPNCTRLLGKYESAGFVNLVMEYAQDGDLFSALSTVGPMDAATARFVGGEVASALDAVHKAGLIFGDLKPENILVHANGHVKLGDFGATREKTNIMTGDAPLEGTLCYLAPELFKRRDVGEETRILIPEAIDWWAFGCLLFQMLTGRPPLWVEEERDLVENLVSFKISKYPQGFPVEAEELVNGLLQHDPHVRIHSMLAVEAMAFFAPLPVAFKNLHQEKAPKFTRGKVVLEKGPWTQRAYSMIHSPLPERYGRNDLSEILSTVEESNLERNFNWQPVVVKEMLSTLPPVSESTVGDGGPMPNFSMDAMLRPVRPPINSQQKKQGKYMVKGLDLSAG